MGCYWARVLKVVGQVAKVIGTGASSTSLERNFPDGAMEPLKYASQVDWPV